MKLRLTAGSVRLRLSGAEVRELALRGALLERLALDPSGRALVYGVEVLADPGAIPSLAFEDDHLLVRVPADLAADWLAGRTEGVNAEITGPDGPLRVTVETDRLG